MLECDVGVPPRHRFAVGNGQDDFNRCREHGSGQASSMVARSGNCAWRASEVTVSTFVSATSHGYTPAMPLPFWWTCIMIRYASAGGFWKTLSSTCTTNSIVV